MLSFGVWWSRVPCASPWGSPDRGARRVSSWRIRMELLRIAMRALCHQREGSLHLAHTDSPLTTCGIAHSTRMSHIRNSVPPTFHPNVSHPEFFSEGVEDHGSTWMQIRKNSLLRKNWWRNTHLHLFLKLCMGKRRLEMHLKFLKYWDKWKLISHCWIWLNKFQRMQNS